LAEETEKIVALMEKVTTSELLIREDTPAKEAIDEATRIKKKFDASVERLNQYQAYQETLKIQSTPIQEVTDFEKQFNIRNRLWTIRQTFTEQQRRWYGENFRD